MKLKHLFLVALIIFGSAGYLPKSWAYKNGIAAAAPQFSGTQRTVLNVSFVDLVWEYAFIDVVKPTSTGISPAGNGNYGAPGYWFTLGNPMWNSSILDAEGWPTTTTDATSVWGGHYVIPASSDYGAAANHGWVISWTGDCRITNNSVITPSSGATSITWSNVTRTAGTNFTNNGNGDWQGTDVTLTANATNSGKQEIGWRITANKQFTGAACRRVHIYRQDDAADFLAGKVYRTPWKNLIVAQDPGAIRFMNWFGGNGSFQNRWENRGQVAYGAWGGSYQTLSPPYGDTTNSANDYSLVAVSGTPVAMTHGEIAQARLNATMINGSPSGTQTAVSTFNKCLPGTTCTCVGTPQVTTSTNHGYTTGDQVTFLSGNANTMFQLNLWNTTVTVCDATHFNTTIDSTALTGTFAGTVMGFITLNVGSRGAYPIMDPTGQNPVTADCGAGCFHANDIRTFYFDKTIFGSRDGTGNPIAGAWLVGANNFAAPGYLPPQGEVPVEVLTTMIKELNDLSPAHPINMYLNMPVASLMPMDPDYSSGSDFPKNVLATVLNGANGYPALPAAAHLFIEYSNETWNNGAAFSQYYYTNARSYLRTGRQAIGLANGATNNNYYSALRSVAMVADMGTNSKMSPVEMGQGAVGFGTNNYIRFFGENPGGLNLFYPEYASGALTGLPTVAKTGDTHTSSSITNVNVANVQFGMGVTCSDCAAGTVVTAVGASSVTINPNATGTHTGVSLTFLPTPISYHYAGGGAHYFDPPTAHRTSFTATIDNGSGSAGTRLTITGCCVAVGSFVNAGPAVGDFVTDGNGGGAGNVSVNPNTTIVGSAAFNSSACTPSCTGNGGNGTYAVSVSQLVASRAMTKDQYMHYATGTGTFTDDSALYNGTDNSANGGGNYAGAANTTQATTNFINQVIGLDASEDSQSTALYKSLFTAYAATFSPLGITTMAYEGMGEWITTTGVSYGSHTITSADQNLLLAAQGSTQWSTALQSFNTSMRAGSMSGSPAFYVMVDCRWGYVGVACTGSAPIPDDYSGGVEGAALNTPWTANGTVNQTLNFLLKRDLDPAANDNTPMFLSSVA